MELSDSIANTYRPIGTPTDTLLTKILLGTIGCVPAYDRYFKMAVADIGAAPKTFSENSLIRLGNLYLDHWEPFEALRAHCSRHGVDYPAAKILDMCLFEYGISMPI